MAPASRLAGVETQRALTFKNTPKSQSQITTELAPLSMFTCFSDLILGGYLTLQEVQVVDIHTDERNNQELINMNKYLIQSIPFVLNYVKNNIHTIDYFHFLMFWQPEVCMLTQHTQRHKATAPVILVTFGFVI